MRLRKLGMWRFAAQAGICILVSGPPVGAQEAESPGTGVVDIGTLSVVGSRLPGRSAQDSPVPVDVIQGDDLQTYGIRDMDSLL